MGNHGRKTRQERGARSFYSLLTSRKCTTYLQAQSIKYVFHEHEVVGPYDILIKYFNKNRQAHNKII